MLLVNKNTPMNATAKEQALVITQYKQICTELIKPARAVRGQNNIVFNIRNQKPIISDLGENRR